MKHSLTRLVGSLGLCAATLGTLGTASADPTVSRLTPPSALFSFGDTTPRSSPGSSPDNVLIWRQLFGRMPEPPSPAPCFLWTALP